MASLENLEIRKLVSSKKLSYKEIALRVGITQEYLSKCMRFPLKSDMKLRIMAAIEQLSNGKPNVRDDEDFIRMVVCDETKKLYFIGWGTGGKHMAIVGDKDVAFKFSSMEQAYETARKIGHNWMIIAEEMEV